jgi:hypothetical protein
MISDHHQYLLSPHFAGGVPMKVSFYYKNVDKSQPAFFIVGYSTYSDPDNIGFTTDESYVASSGEWELCETYCPLDTRYVVIAWYGDNTKGGALYVDDFVFEVGEPCPWAGSGTVDAPYMITTTGELDALARKVNGGETYEGQYFKMGGTEIQIRTSGYAKFADIELDPEVLNGDKLINVTGILTNYRGAPQFTIIDLEGVKVVEP